MALSENRLRANRENAQRSTGPRTPDGQARARRNALKHGLAGQGAVLLPEDEPLYQERLEAWNASLRPRDPVEHYLVSRAVVRSIQLDRSTRLENAQRVERVRQADSQFRADRLSLLEQTEATLRQFGRLGRALKRRGWLEFDELETLGDLLGPLPPGDPRAADLMALGEEAAPPVPAGQPTPSTLPPQLLAFSPAPAGPPSPPETRADRDRRRRAREALAALIADHRVLLKQERARLLQDLASPAALVAARDRAAIEPDAPLRRYATASEQGLFRTLNFLARRRRGEASPDTFEGVPLPAASVPPAPVPDSPAAVPVPTSTTVPTAAPDPAPVDTTSDLPEAYVNSLAPLTSPAAAPLVLPNEPNVPGTLTRQDTPPPPPTGRPKPPPTRPPA